MSNTAHQPQHAFTTRLRATRGVRANIGVLIAASLVGMWLGMTAPSTSPVTPPPPPPAATSAGQPT